MKPPIDHTSVKTQRGHSQIIGPFDHEHDRLGFELRIQPGAIRSRADVVRLLIRRMIAHAFTFDAKAYVITVTPVERIER